MTAQNPIPDSSAGDKQRRPAAPRTPIQAWPVAARELSLASRKPWTYYARCVTAGIATLIVAGLLQGVLIGVISPASAGWNMFRILSCLLFGFVLLEGAWTAADSLSREKREGTLGLIFLTRLSPGEIVYSKLIACGLGPLFGLLATIPVPAISFFLGGLSWGEYARMMLALANSLFFAFATALFVSACSRNERRALAGALLCILGMSFLVPALGVFFWNLAEVRGSDWLAALAVPLLVCAPTTSVLVVLRETAIIPADIASASTYLLSLAVSHGLGWCLLVFAARVLRSNWREEHFISHPQDSTEHSQDRVIRRGNSQALPRSVDRRPCALRLAERGMTPCYMLYVGALMLLAGWGIGFALWGPRVAHWLGMLGSLLFLHACLKFDLAIQATRALSEERRTGALEILLTTPLDPEEIVRGRMLALKRHFFWPTLALILTDFLALPLVLAQTSATASFSKVIIPGLGGAMLFVGLQLADLYTLCWSGIWLGYRYDEPGRALRHTLLNLVLGPFFLQASFLAVPILFFGPSSTAAPAFGAVMLGLWIVAGSMTNLALCARAIGGLRDQFRATAASVETRGRMPRWAERIFKSTAH